MKIINANAGHLTNFEVLEFLRSKGASKDSARVMARVATSELKVFDYLEETAACNQNRERIKEFLEKCKDYGLAKAEIINIINLRPSSPVELVPIIEEWEERMGDRLEELAEMVAEVLPPPPIQPNMEAEAEVDNENAEGGEKDEEKKAEVGDGS